MEVQGGWRYEEEEAYKEDASEIPKYVLFPEIL